jgi:uncharacterized alkaline shock family protein YloU
MLVVAVVLILIGARLIQPQMVVDLILAHCLNAEFLKVNGFFNPIMIAGIVLLLLSLKTTVFLSTFKIKNKTPIIVKTRNGEVQISQDTIENSAKAVTLTFDNVKDAQVTVIKKKNNRVIINEAIQVYSNTNIRELTDAILEEVRENISATTGVIVLKVNIKIKNVYSGRKEAPSKAIVYVPKQTPTEAEVFNVDEAVKKAEEAEAEQVEEEKAEETEEPKEEATEESKEEGTN